MSAHKPVIALLEPDGFCEEALRILESGAVVAKFSSRVDDLAELMDRCDVLWLRLGYRIQEKDIRTGQRCKCIATPVTGLNHIDLEACRRNHIKVISLKGETHFLNEVRATAEHTFALLLSGIRRIVPAAEHVRLGGFNRDLFEGRELFQKTLGVIGYGRLGKMVAAYARAFGMRVIVHEIDPGHAAREADIINMDLDALLQEADVVSLHVDWRPENQHLVDAGFLANMKKTAWLINTSRGGLIDEQALVTALEKRWIAGAAIDVVEGEPDVDMDSLLMKYYRTHDNLLITPHIGGKTTESVAKTEIFIAQKIMDALHHA
ncbi:MAG TPA: NAD(P)-dependent oxidoreductase [Saprospiraceae bacterium]|nr:NAD(P)-dependent oxidoreductase [Saprospiraceae bacterium]